MTFTKTSRTRKSVQPLSCDACGLSQDILVPYGNFKKKIMCIGESPLLCDMQQKKGWQSAGGQFLRRALSLRDIDLFEDCINLSAVACCPQTVDGNDRFPSEYEMACCRKRVIDTIDGYQPRLILLFGEMAMKSVIHGNWRKDDKLPTLDQMRGWVIPDRTYNAWICVLNNPIMVAEAGREIITIWEQDLERALLRSTEPLPTDVFEESKVEIVEDLKFLTTLTGPVAFDYETTGLKPHNTAKHEIICMSVCNDWDKSYAFMMPTDPIQKHYIKQFLKSNVGKIAQNMKFEINWSQNILKYVPNNWVWDTMLATHVMDNRSGVTGLKFQTYVQFGVVDYNSDVSPYLKAKDYKNGNAVNKIKDLIKTEDGKRKLLMYCGLDSLFEYRLAMLQMRHFNVR